jgi:hypothetical protein
MPSTKNLVTPFAILATHDSSKDFILSVPTKLWRANCGVLYPTLNCDIVERTQILWAPKGFRWMWCDENGHPKALAINPRATALYIRARNTGHWIAGPVAIEGRPVDMSRADAFLAIRREFEYLKETVGFPPEAEIQHYKESQDA